LVHFLSKAPKKEINFPTLFSLESFPLPSQRPIYLPASFPALFLALPFRQKSNKKKDRQRIKHHLSFKFTLLKLCLIKKEINLFLREKEKFHNLLSLLAK